MTYDFTAERIVYNTLKSVFINKAYSSIELDRALAAAADNYRGRITALVYGVLEKSVTLDYYISKLTAKKPKNNIEILLKLAVHDLLFGTDAEYAVIDKYVQFAKDRFSGIHGFVNAVLRKVKTIFAPDGNLSVKYSCPEWVVARLLRDYGERATALLSAQAEKMTHIRFNSRVTDKAKFETGLKGIADNITATDLGYYVNRTVLKKLAPGSFTPQSLSSARAVKIYADGMSTGMKILDLCAAPGGKSIYLEELIGGEITACDIHPHRTELIRSYALRMGSKVKTAVNDATKLNPAWKGAFDLVICDVPCSGSGLLKSSPDILLFKSDGDVARLAKLQYEILSSAAAYVKSGGVLAYSTCSLFNDENEGVADKFTAEHKDFAVLPHTLGIGENVRGYTKLYPDVDKCDGFFIAKWKKQ